MQWIAESFRRHDIHQKRKKKKLQYRRLLRTDIIPSHELPLTFFLFLDLRFLLGLICDF